MIWLIFLMNIRVSWYPLTEYYHESIGYAVHERHDFGITVDAEISLFNDIIFMGGNIIIPIYNKGNGVYFVPSSLGSMFYVGAR